MGNRIAPAGGTRISFALLAFALVAGLVGVVAWAPPAQAVAGDTGPGPIPSASTTTLDGRQWESKNQHRIWWNSSESRWDAILPTTTGWKIASGAIPTAPGIAPVYGGVVSADPSDRPDIYWDDANSRLYVLMSGGTTTLFTYTYNGTSYGLNTTSTLPSMEPGEGRAAIYKSPNGNLWASMMDSDGSVRGSLHRRWCELARAGQAPQSGGGRSNPARALRDADRRGSGRGRRQLASLQVSLLSHWLKTTTPGTPSPTPRGR